MSKPNPFVLLDEFTDFRGNTFRAGDVVVYAGMSGRSAQLIEAEVLEIQHVTPEYGQPFPRLKLLPTGRYSRWAQHWSGREYERDENGKLIQKFDRSKVRAVLVAAEMAVKP